jgi:hypothetical protein
MTNRTWLPSTSDAFDNPFDWSPFGAPQPGDALTIGDGNPVATALTLSGYTIYLGGLRGDPGPALVPFLNDGSNSYSFTSAPNPTLTLTGATIASNTS